jgi:hypothetical protein
MLALRFIAVVVAMCDALLAAGAWKALSRDSRRPPLARAIGAIAGAVAGAWLTEPQLGVVVWQLGYLHEAGQLAIGFTYPFVLPATTGMGAWLFAETMGGRSPMPWRAASKSYTGALIGTALVFLPMFLVPRAFTFLGIGHPIAVGAPIAGSLLGLAIESRKHGGMRSSSSLRRT